MIQRTNNWSASLVRANLRYIITKDEKLEKKDSILETVLRKVTRYRPISDLASDLTRLEARSHRMLNLRNG